MSVERASAALARMGGAPDLDWAFVFARDGRAFAASAPRFRPGGSRTAATELIQGVFDRLRDHSFFVLREPIWLSGAATPLCRGMAKVAAKKLVEGWAVGGAAADPGEDVTVVASSPGDARWSSGTAALEAWPEPEPPRSDADFLKLVSRLALQVERGSVLHRYHRPLACVVASREGEILSWATNAASENKTLHAELNAVQALPGGLPPGARIYASLKPCRMCAGAIWSAALEPASLDVVYAEEDPGSLARATALDIGSEERRRAGRDEGERAAAIQRRA